MTRVRKTIPILLAVSALILLAACEEDNGAEQREQEDRFFQLYLSSRYPDEAPRPSGLYFIPFSEGSGESPDTGDWILMNYVATMIPQERIFDTNLENVARDINLYDQGVLYGPYKVPTGDLVEGVTEGLQLMKEGGKAIVFFQSDLGYGSEGYQVVPAYQSLKYEVELLEVIGNIEAYEQQRLMTYVDTIPWNDTIHDPETDATLYYVTYEQGEGDTIVTGSTVEVIYTGRLIDGRVFDQNLNTGDPFEFEIGESEVIKGWDLALVGFQEGWRGKLVIPYQLAYGETGQTVSVGNRRFRSMPPYENLIFEMEILDVTAPKVDEPD